MDFSKLSQNNQIAAGGALLTLISGFLPWFSVGRGSDAFNDSGFGSGLLALLGIVLVVAGGVILLLKVLDQQDVKLQGLSAEQLAMVLSALGLLFIILRFLFKGDAQLFGVNLPVGRSWGMFVGIIGAIATTAGAFLSAQDKGIGIPTADDFTGDGGGGEPTTF